MATSTELPVDDLFPNPKQPRKAFQPGPLKELALSIKKLGLVQPVTVVPSDGRYMIVAGERRWRATKLAGLTTIPAIVRSDLTVDGVADVALMENLLREDLNPIEEARGYQERLDAGYSMTQLVEMLGYKGDAKILDRLALLKLTPEIQEALVNRLIRCSQARQLAYLSPEGQRRAFAAINSGKAQTTNALRRIVVAIYDAENQRNLFREESQLSAVEKRSLTQVDKFIEGADRLLSILTDEDFQLIRLTLKSDAPRCIDKLGLLMRVSARLKLSLETASAKFDERQVA